MWSQRLVPVSVGRFLDIGGRDSAREVGGCGKTPGVPTFGPFIYLCEEDFFSFSPSCPRHETLQLYDQ